MRKAIAAVALAFVCLAGVVVPAEAQTARYAPRPTPSVWACRTKTSVIENPVASAAVPETQGNGTGFFDGRLAARGVPVTTASEMTGFVFDGSLFDPYDRFGRWSSTKGMYFVMEYELPVMPCRRQVRYSFDVDIQFPNGVLAYSWPGSNVSVDVGTVESPTGRWNARNIPAFELTVAERLWAAAGPQRAVHRVSGDMVVEAGRQASLLVVVYAGILSWGGNYCIGRCQPVDESNWGEEGRFDVLDTRSGLTGAPGIRIDETPL